MVSAPAGRFPPENDLLAHSFVCPFCGTTSDGVDGRTCARCGGTPVVPVDDSTVYETVVPACGPGWDVTRSRLGDADSPPRESTDADSPLSTVRRAADAVCRSLVRRAKTMASALA